jgi:hypothetical protein
MTHVYLCVFFKAKHLSFCLGSKSWLTCTAGSLTQTTLRRRGVRVWTIPPSIPPRGRGAPPAPSPGADRGSDSEGGPAPSGPPLVGRQPPLVADTHYLPYLGPRPSVMNLIAHMGRYWRPIKGRLAFCSWGLLTNPGNHGKFCETPQ